MITLDRCSPRQGSSLEDAPVSCFVIVMEALNAIFRQVDTRGILSSLRALAMRH
jgi:hypothetical protein